MHRVEFESRKARGGMTETFEIICGLHVFMMHKLFVPCLSWMNWLEQEGAISNYGGEKKQFLISNAYF